MIPSRPHKRTGSLAGGCVNPAGGCTNPAGRRSDPEARAR